METSNVRERLLTDPPSKLLVSMSLPAIIAMVVIGLYNLMDSIFVGQLVGPNEMAAVSIGYSFTIINSGLAVLIGMGSASVLSRAIGRRDQETVDKIMGNLVFLIIILSIAVTIIGELFTEQLVMLSGAEGDIKDFAVSYLRIVFLGSIFVNFAQAANMVMRGEGVLKRAMMIMIFGAVVNLVLDPIMILGMRDMGLGVEAAAIATVIAQISQAAITLYYFKKKSQNVRIHKIRLERSIVPGIMKVGISAMLMQWVTLVQYVVIYYVAAKYGGSDWQIIMSAAMRIQAFAFIPLWGITQGFQPVAGTNYGANKFDRVKSCMKIFTIWSTILTLIFFIPIELFPNTMLSLFITDPAIVSMGVNDLRMLFSTFFLLGFVIMSVTLFQSLGKGGKAIMIIVPQQLLIVVPLLFILPSIGGLGVHGLFMAPAIATVAVFIYTIVMVLNEFKDMNRKAASTAVIS